VATWIRSLGGHIEMGKPFKEITNNINSSTDVGS
jgi:hypothetical protein